ncbi:hypothetical protein Tco_0268834, partial [Tanacetum coccineum]
RWQKKMHFLLSSMSVVYMLTTLMPEDGGDNLTMEQVRKRTNLVMLKVLEQVESVAYKLKLPQELSRVHNTFHVSNLRKCYADEPLAVPLGGLHLDNEL